jgi:hypothetical protein
MGLSDHATGAHSCQLKNYSLIHFSFFCKLKNRQTNHKDKHHHCLNSHRLLPWISPWSESLLWASALPCRLPQSLPAIVSARTAAGSYHRALSPLPPLHDTPSHGPPALLPPKASFVLAYSPLLHSHLLAKITRLGDTPTTTSSSETTILSTFVIRHV